LASDTPGLLFAAVGFAWQSGKQLIPALATLGVGVSLTSLVPLWFAHRAIQRFYQDWNTKKDPNYNGPDVIGYYSEIRGINYFLP
jgi:hypothetical protein